MIQKMLGVSYSTLKSLRLKGVLPYSKIGGSIYYNHLDIIKVLNENKICNFRYIWKSINLYLKLWQYLI